MAQMDCKLYHPTLPSVKVHINTYSRSDVFDILEKHIPVNITDLKTGFLWPIFFIGDSLKFSAQLVHFVLCHEIITDKKNEMWFKICGKIARFSILEFAAITGLNCSELFHIEVPHVNPRSEFNITTLTYEVLVDILQQETDLKKKTRWAYLLLVDYVLLPKRRNSEVDHTIYALSADLDSFSKYPWGRSCYNELITSLMQVNRADHNITKNRFGYNLKGYPLAFQVWILETFPEFANAVGASCTIERRIPFLVRWSTKSDCKFTRKGKIMKVTSSQNFKCIFPLTHDFGDLSTLKYNDEVADAVFDQYFQIAISITSNETNLLENFIKNVIDDSVVEVVASDNFDVDPNPVSKRRICSKWHNAKRGNFEKGKVQTYARKRIKNSAVKSSSANKNQDLKIVRVVESKKFCKQNSVPIDDIPLVVADGTVKKTEGTTSQIMRKLKTPSDAFFPEWAKILMTKLDAQEKLLSTLNSRVTDNSLQLENISKDVKIIKANLAGRDVISLNTVCLGILSEPNKDVVDDKMNDVVDEGAENENAMEFEGLDKVRHC